ncbi:hypothetical protein COA01_29940 [Bacillus cereus]|uniref:S8 family peptidase n=1 Tax=Bacillus cereus TaxID=1396 RepID=UPI000BFBBC83|nr:S8 family serine peptidase [Bacillus cereus]PGP14585.1 hypothetical protein COA01_29940 [Bacillus cereus]
MKISNKVFLFLILFVFFISIGINPVTAETIREGDYSVDFPEIPKWDTTFYKEVDAVQPINTTYLNDLLITDLWNQGYYGKGIKIAIIDTGVETNHPDLKITKTVNCIDDLSSCSENSGDYDSDSAIHGTHVSGIINAQHNNYYGKGIAPQAEIYVLKTSSYKDGKVITNDKVFANAVKWARENGVDIINLSSGWNTWDTDISEPLNLRNEIFNAVHQGILCVISAGNEGRNNYIEKVASTVTFPAIMRGVISVSNVGMDLLNLSGSSSIGKEVFIGATGTGINSTIPIFYDNDESLIEIDGNTIYHKWDKYNPVGYQQLNGTSMAAPIVSGILALLKEKYPNATAEELKDYLAFMAKYTVGTGLNQRVDEVYKKMRNDEFGFGVIQAEMGSKIDGEFTPLENSYFYNLPSEKYKTSETTIKDKKYSIIRVLNTDEAIWYEVKVDDKKHRWIKLEFKKITSNLKFPYLDLSIYDVPIAPPKFIGVMKKDTNYKILNYVETKDTVWYKIEYDVGFGPMNGWVPIEAPEHKSKLTFKNRENMYFNIGGSTDGGLNPQTVYTTRKIQDWYEINTWKGKRWIKPTNFVEGDFNLTTVNRETLYTKNTDGTFSSTVETLAPQTVTGLFREGEWFQINTWQGPRWIKPKSYFIGNFSVSVPKKVKFYTKKNDLTSFYSEYDSNTFEVVKRDGSWFLTTYGYWINPSEYYLGVFQIKLLESKNIYNTTIYGTEYVGSLSPQTVFAYGVYSLGWSGSSGAHYPAFQINSWLGKVYILGEADTDSIKGIQLIEYDDNLLQ